MITKKMSECVGMKASLDHDIINGAGQCIARGSIVKIVGYSRAFTIETERCQHCGQYCRIRNVKKSELTLLDIQGSAADMRTDPAANRANW